MIEFYTKRFRERAKNQIKEVNDMIKGVLPNLYKWQMKGCYLIEDDYTVLYRPLVDGENNQVGTDIEVTKDNKEKYFITSGEEIIRVRHEEGKDLFETYYTVLKNDTLLTQVILNFKEDFISVKIQEKDGKEEIDVASNLDGEQIKEALLDRGDSNILDYIKTFYHDNEKSIQRVRK